MKQREFVVAQIGCGAFAMGQHGPNLVKNSQITRIKWACDTSETNAKQYAAAFGAEKTTASFEDATSDPEVDLIFIATSHEIHVPIIESAAKHGKHIYCEKPMAMDEYQSYQIIRAIRKNGVKLCVGYMRRMAPAVVRLKEEWLAHKQNPQRQPWRYIEKKRDKLVEETTTDFNVRVQDESASYRMVHLDPFRGGGLIIGEAAHWLDLSCWLFENDRPVEIQAWGSTRMRYGIHLSFQSGNAATITFTPNGSFDYPKEIYEIACDGALFRNEFYVENQYYGRPGIEREIFPLQRDSQPDTGKQGGLAGYLEKHQARVRKAHNAKEGHESLIVDHGYEDFLAGFLDAIVNDTKTPCDELDGYHATLMAELAVKSIELKQAISIPVEKWDYYIEL